MKRKLFLIVTLVLFLSVQSVFAYTNEVGVVSVRYSGSDRYDTAVEVSERFDSPSEYILASGGNFPDALSGVALTFNNRPILLSRKNSLDSVTKQKLRKAERVYILGGKGVISESVKETIESYGVEVIRISGKNRYDTSLEIAKKVTGSNEIKTLIVTGGHSYPDALSASNLVRYTGGPVVLLQKNKIPEKTKEFLNKLKPDKIYIVGGKSIISSSVEAHLRENYCENVERISGTDRYKTNQKTIEVAGGFVDETSELVIATARNYPDGLSAGAFCTNYNSVLMLVGSSLRSEQKDILQNISFYEANLHIVGGRGAVSEKVENDILNCLNGFKKYIIADGTAIFARVITSETQRNQFLSLINNHRAENGRTPLEYEYSWIEPSNLRAVETSYLFDHKRPDGTNFSTAFSNPKPRGENIAAGQRSVIEVFNAWKGSPGHNANMLRADATKLMFSAVEVDNSDYGIYWVTVFR